MVLDAQHGCLIFDVLYMVVKAFELVDDRVWDKCRVEDFTSVFVSVLGLDLARVVGDRDGRAIGSCRLGSIHVLGTWLGFFS